MSTNSERRPDINFWRDRLSHLAREVMVTRLPQHGNHLLSQGQCGEAVRAIMGSFLGKELPEVPARVSNLMMCMFKLLRAARGSFLHEDEYVDALNYLIFAYEAHVVEAQAWVDPALGLLQRKQEKAK